MRTLFLILFGGCLLNGSAWSCDSSPQINSEVKEKCNCHRMHGSHEAHAKKTEKIVRSNSSDTSLGEQRTPSVDLAAAKTVRDTEAVVPE